jgi:hypothetical protein
MSRYTYTLVVNTVHFGRTFKTASAALARVKQLKRKGIHVTSIQCRGESIPLLDLEAIARLEKQEHEHNKRQGL